MSNAYGKSMLCLPWQEVPNIHVWSCTMYRCAVFVTFVYARVQLRHRRCHQSVRLCFHHKLV